ncbi:MAG: hypothetical protein PHC92_06235 [Syntrophomonadaceae bacterium]|nr:hypothetical protein [Syntrophomonadaceae bacterium]
MLIIDFYTIIQIVLSILQLKISDYSREVERHKYRIIPRRYSRLEILWLPNHF